MKKFIKSIEICPDNIWDVLNCPIVDCIHKEKSMIHVEGRGEPYSVLSSLVVDVTGFGPFTINNGNIIALDICGTWHAFTKEEWDRYKNDEI